MSGFEHQVAAHLMAEGLVEESLILTRVIQERYHAAKRNPFNEIECSDHYARAMASYGTFIAACGFEYHGPKGYIRFAPKWNSKDFKAPFTSASGWGTYMQKQEGLKQVHQLEMKYGELQIQQISLEKMNKGKVKSVLMLCGAVQVPVSFTQEGTSLIISSEKKINVKQEEILNITVS